MTNVRPIHLVNLTAITVATMVLSWCDNKQSPDRRDPYGEMARGLRDKGAHKKGTGFND